IVHSLALEDSSSMSLAKLQVFASHPDPLPILPASIPVAELTGNSACRVKQNPTLCGVRVGSSEISSRRHTSFIPGGAILFVEVSPGPQ
ncbi:MAG TPA: hypothetical protein VJH94_02380, partial [Candidatus Paceibacterota bacterium]